MPARWEAFFEALDRPVHSTRHLVWHAPTTGPARAVVVYAHPFGDEMNKARRMVALQARRLAEAGCAVLLPDLLGCGDSAGEFADATWQDWLHDVDDACTIALDRCRAGFPGAPAPALWLWGLRGGALLASAVAARRDDAAGLLLWQPAPNGRLLLQQFLRLKAAALMQQGEGKAEIERLRQALAAGQAVDVAGYRLAPALADGLQAAALVPPRPGTQVVWLETGAGDDAGLLPASAALVERWTTQGLRVDTRRVTGPGFWATVEIETAPALLEATAQALSDGGRP
jgi:exosortase A-associated hydrolase 2